MAEAITVSAVVEGTDPDDGKVLTFESGQLAQLAGGAVVASLGDTRILMTATAAKSVRDGIDFFPLTVDIEERMYAAGKIPGSFFRREGRASESAILTCRLIDRPLRPSFPEGFRNEVHVVGTLFGADMTNPYDVVAINGASAALTVSNVPFDGPLGAVRIGFDADAKWIPFPTFEESKNCVFEMVVAGRQLDDGDIAVMMVEAGGTEGSWELYENGATKVDEDVLAGGLEACKPYIRQVIAMQNELLEKVGGKPDVMSFVPQIDYTDEIKKAVEKAGAKPLAATQQIADKAERDAAEGEAKAAILEKLAGKFDDTPNAEKQIKAAVRAVTKEAVRSRIVNDGVRIDGRGTSDLRALSSEVSVIPTAHGSGLFQRGETQVLNFTTLGMKRMDQMIDGIDPIDRKRYLHHYNFPPFSTGETGFMRGPKRREIGHGALAERALVPVIPNIEEFPYTLRLVSEVLTSNGSTSMASVCGSTLSLMDAGVPIKAPVAGIAMGLVYADDKYTTLTDILGAEDAFGDMDFKVAGTPDFVTALQLDTKIDGIPADVLAAALNQAKEARLEILDVMAGAIAEPRDEVGPTAPKIVSFEIPIDKIGEVIGPKGKVINAIQGETGADITVDDDGTVGIVSIASSSKMIVDEAERQIKLILNPPTAEVGETYKGRVVNITKFGAFVNILPGRDGLVHISKLGGGKRIDRVEDVVDLGDEIDVTVEDVDPSGRISLTPVGVEVPDSAVSDGGGGGGGRERSERPSRDRGDRPSRGRGEGNTRRPRRERGSRDDAPKADAGSDGDDDGGREYVSFEDSFESELKDEFGDLGPAAAGGGESRGGRGGRGGGGRSRRRR